MNHWLISDKFLRMHAGVTVVAVHAKQQVTGPAASMAQWAADLKVGDTCLIYDTKTELVSTTQLVLGTSSDIFPDGKYLPRRILGMPEEIASPKNKSDLINLQKRHQITGFAFIKSNGNFFTTSFCVPLSATHLAFLT